MPDQITVSEFVAETNEDYKSPTASNFTTRMSHCRNTVAALEEVRERSIDAARLLSALPLLPFFIYFGLLFTNLIYQRGENASHGSVYVPLFPKIVATLLDSFAAVLTQ